jgi:hypothetical protein
MTFLQLVQRLSQYCGIPGTGPSTTVGQTGEAGRLVNWTNDAWRDIQTAHQDWDWMRTTATWPTTQAQYAYTPTQAGITSGTFGMWAPYTFRCYETASGTNSEMFLDWLPYDVWRNTYLFGALRQSYARPTQMAIAPDKSVVLGPIPLSGFSITGDYFTAPLDMSADADVPALPTQYQMAIVYRAMMFYGTYEAAQEVYANGEREFAKLMARINADRLPQVMLTGALA